MTQNYAQTPLPIDAKITSQERLANLQAYTDLYIELYKICKENPSLLEDDDDKFLEYIDSQEYEDYCASFDCSFEDLINDDEYISDNAYAERLVANAM